MSKIKVSELFYSIQGEGRYMGVPSVFLRTFGCNFTCGGFGMPKGEHSTERDTVALKATEYKSYKELPLVSTGCDSYASWDVRFKHLSPLIEVKELVESIIELLPKKWPMPGWGDEHLVITGGEPLLGWQRSYPELLDHTQMRALKELTFETNGTQELHSDMIAFLEYWKKDMYPRQGLLKPRDYNSLTFSVSPKLSPSGEKYEDAIKPEIIMQYDNIGYTYLKFVVTKETESEEIWTAVEDYRSAGFRGPVYLMPVGGVEQVYSMNNKDVAEMAMKMGFRYSDRLQVPLFKNAWGT